jgi:cell division protein ZapD
VDSEKIIFCQPLNERLRFFTRLDFLFKVAQNSLHSTTSHDSHITLSTLLEIINFVKQQDSKREVVSELERILKILNPLQNSPDIEHGTLHQILESLNEYRGILHGIQGPIGNELRENEFLKTTLQRKNVPGGLSDYDPPIYKHWLMQPAEKRIGDLTQWLSVFGILRDAIQLILQMVRESASPVCKTAESGLYQQNLDTSVSYQMVYVALPVDTAYFAEISGGKHRFTVRFMDATVLPRPTQTANDVDFELYCCVL